MAKVFIRFKSGFELPITCDEFKLKTTCGEILSYDIKGIEDNKPLFLRTEDVECIYQRMEKAEALRWIPVTERLPDDDSWAIWCSKNGVQQIARLKTDAIDHFFPSQGFFNLDDAAAWMPLPEPYKAGEIITQ